MNRTIVTHVLLLSTIVWCRGEPPRFLSLSDPALKERGPHHRTWERVSSYVTSYGRVVNRINSFQEIGTGICYWDGAEWKDTEEVFELFRDGAVARKGPHQVIISPRITDAPAIDMLTPDGKRLRCRLFGVVYRDTIRGNNILIAEPNPDSIVTLVPPNRVVWENALLDFSADLQVTYTRAGVEAELILRERPDAPDAWNMNARDTRIQVWTEWFDPPEPRKEAEVVREETDPNLRQVMADPQVIDETLDFGHMRFVQGRAFRIGEGEDEEAVRVAKQWVNVEDRTFLIESVDYLESKPMLDGLPLADVRQALPAAELARRTARTPAELVAAVSFRGDSEIGTFASRQAKVVNSGSEPQLRASSTPTLRVAQQRSGRAGVSIDWTAVSSQSNWVFKSDTTHYVTSLAIMTGTTVIEGGTVIKFTNYTGANLAVRLSGPVDCRTSRAHPAVFTAKDDNTVGEIIGSITNTPGTNIYGGQGLGLFSSGTTFDLHDLRFRYINQAVFTQFGSLKLSHSQIGYGNSGAVVISPAYSELQNVLMHDLKVQAFIGTSTGTNRGEHVTVHRCPTLKGISSITLFLTNSLLIGVTNNVTFSGVNVDTNQNEAGYFQSVGSGSRYLANNSPHRNAGTTNISTNLLAELRSLTTYPPVHLASDISISTTLSPQAQRDGDAPDLGYHYPPMDFLIGSTNGIVLSNALLLITNSAVVAFNSAATNYGLRVADASSVVGQGTPVALNRLVWSQAIQEVPAGGTTNAVPMIADTYPAPEDLPGITLRFTDIPMIAGSYFLHQENGRGTFDGIRVEDCQIGSGKIRLFGGITNQTIWFFNNLLDRTATYVDAYPPQAGQFQFNLFREGSFHVGSGVSSSWSLYNNLFDKVDLSQSTNRTITHNFNGYITGYEQFYPPGANDVIQTASSNVGYEIGPLGGYYRPVSSVFIDAGSATANTLGFYHWCVTTNQVKETNSTVDIGYHYVALNASNQPVDSDGEGLPDYLEDIDGDGSQDTGETSFANADSDGDGVSDFLEWVQGRNPLASGTVVDTNGLINLKVYTPLK